MTIGVVIVEIFFICHEGSHEGGNIKYLICHVTSQNIVIEEPCNFKSGSSSWYVSTLPSLVTIGIVAIEICF